MVNINQEIIDIISLLKRYSKAGYMDSYEINEIISRLQTVYNKDNMLRMNKLMDDVTAYMVNLSDSKQSFVEFVKSNISTVAALLNKSERTIYRKIQNDSFTLLERRKIMDELQ